MSTGADDGTGATGEAATPLPGDAESIDDLIDEASRTASEQAAQEATGTAPVDRSSDVWGGFGDEDDDAPDDDLDALWSAAADRHQGGHVFDDVLGPDDDWGSGTRVPPPATDPTVASGAARDTPDDEPEVFELPIDEDESGDDAVWASPEDEDDAEPFRFAAGPATRAPAVVPDHADVDGAEEPDAFAFAFDAADETDADGTDADAATGDGTPADEDLDDGTAAGPVAGDDGTDDDVTDDDVTDDDVTGDDVTGDDGGTGDDSGTGDDGDDPWTSASDASAPAWEDVGGDEPWPALVDDTPGTGPVPGAPDDDAGDDVWDFAFEGADDRDEGTDEQRSLADAATPRPDTGWDDRSEEQFAWGLDPATGGDDRDGEDRDGDVFFAAASSAPEDDVEGFAVRLDDEDDGEDEGGLRGDEPREPGASSPAGSAELGDVLDDLLGDVPDGDGTDPATADPAPVADEVTPADLDDAAPAAGPAPPPVADPPAPTTPPAPAADDSDEEPETSDEEAAADEPPPTPTAPGDLSFSSSSKKKRGLFGR